MITKKTKHKIEWSKILIGGVVLFLSIYSIWCGIAYYKLTKLAIENNTTMPDATLAVACVGTILGAILSYCLYQGALKTSLNKNRLRIDKTTGVVKAIVENEVLEAVQQTVEDCDNK